MKPIPYCNAAMKAMLKRLAAGVPHMTENPTDELTAQTLRARGWMYGDEITIGGRIFYNLLDKSQG